ncbi:MAG TPA: hypothetical protein VGN69_03255, partial [Solirubrobacteraceae bacterium]|nr:hypothetical protein [Solirubrobacteraceae bacterium]
MSEPGDRLTLLVLGVSSDVSQGMLKALAHCTLRIRLIAACVTPEAVGLFGAQRAYLSPYAADPGFVDWVIDVCRRESVDAVLSGVEPVLAALADASEAIREATGAVCVVSPPATLAVGQDKLEGCRWLAAHGLAHPDFAAGDDGGALDALHARHGFPLVAKPRRGRGSRGVRLLTDEHELAGVRGQADLIVQEHLSDADGEYTVGCLCDRDGRVRGRVAMRRELHE